MVIPTPGRMSQGDDKFEATMGYTARFCLKGKKVRKTDFVKRKDLR